ncbi:MAG TPA: hypothetical protein VHL54_04480 [Actinomycetota bacterium]|nr:hypothetical protein [Actinomycetota bacterium]
MEETLKLLPNEQPKVPDPAAVPKTVTTAAAFGGKPISKDKKDMGPRGETSR